MKRIADLAAHIFNVAVIVLAFVSVLAIWDTLSKDVIGKSFQTISLLAVVAVIVLIADRFVDSRKNKVDPATGQAIIETSSKSFTTVRHVTLSILIAAVAVLAIMGILAIWDVLGGDVLEKTLSSIAVIAFASFVIVLICLERENHPIMGRKEQNEFSFGRAFLLLLISLVIIFWLMSAIF